MGLQDKSKNRSFLLKNTELFEGLDYSFSGDGQVIRWPKEDGIRLGMAGAWNLLFRVGACPCTLEVGDLHVPKEGDVLYVTADMTFSSRTERALLDWMATGGQVVASGCPDAWRFAFPGNVILEGARLSDPHAGLAWLQEGMKPELVAPPNWKYLKVQEKGNNLLECSGKLAAISGERQTPVRALVSLLEDAPAIIRVGNFFYFNGNPFAAFQSWLQGQEILGPWLAWRHRIFWLDEYAAFLAKILRDHRLLSGMEAGIPDLARTTVVLKHDLDYSRDTTYLELESQAGLSGVYAILKDSNTDFWVKTVKSKQGHESSFHYNTAHYSRILEAVRHKFLNLEKRPLRPNRTAIRGKGLLSQVRWAKRNGIGIETLHRHLSFIIYPELVDALDTVYRNETEVLGSNSFFTGQVLRWGTNGIDRWRGTYVDFTDFLVPHFFPFKLAHAGDRGRLLRGWEDTSALEAEPELVEQMLNYNIPGLPQKVIVLNYHPAHTYSFNYGDRGRIRGGSINNFREVLDLCISKGVEVRSLSEVYKILNVYLENQYGK